MDSVFPVHLVSLVPAAICLLVVYLAITSRGRHFPPGPTPLPIIGNMLDIPKVTPWRAYAELAKKYGNVMHLRVFGKSIIMINDFRTAVDLFEKRSANYSSRPRSNMIALLNVGWNVSLMAYGPQWRHHRRVLWQHFHPGVLDRPHSFQYAGVHRLLTKLLDSPEKLREHITYSLGATLLEAVYGLKIADSDDKYISIVEEAVTSGEFSNPGSSILEYFPVLARLPTWLPGTGFLRLKHIARIREAEDKLRTLPWNDAKQRLNTVNSSQSITSAIVAELSHLDAAAAAQEEEVAKSVTGSIYSAAVETTSATLCGFVTAMSLHEDVQKRAQAELDTVVGPNRLPELADRDSLPYVNAIIKETLRWHAVVPLGLLHVNITDDEYEGYFIPKNTMVFPNVWAMLNNPETYNEPEKFMPERFLKDGRLDPTVQDPATIMFGFGRRICPGRHFADATLFLNIASILHMFSIAPPVDEHDEPIRTLPPVTSGVVSYFEESKFTISPRSGRAASEALIHTSEADSRS